MVDGATRAASFIPLRATNTFPPKRHRARLSALFDSQLRRETGNITAAILHVQMKYLPSLIPLQIPRGIIWTQCKFLCRWEPKTPRAHCFTLNRRLSLTPDEQNTSAVVGFAFQSLDASLRNPTPSPDNTLAVAEPLPK